MAFVCVDKDGTEKICNYAPFRRGRKCSVLFGMVTGIYTKNKAAKWADGWSTDEKDILPFFGVVLPKGSIEKLIGKKLMWKDEPVEIK